MAHPSLEDCNKLSLLPCDAAELEAFVQSASSEQANLLTKPDNKPQKWLFLIVFFFKLFTFISYDIYRYEEICYFITYFLYENAIWAAYYDKDQD